MTIAVEAGSNATPISGASSLAVSIATVNPADIILLCATMKAANKRILSITDSAGLSWARLENYLTTDPSIDLWWALAPAAMNGINADSITVNLSSFIAVGNVDVIGISGANFSVPFDPNAASQGTATGTNSIPTVTGISTSNANDMIIGISEINANVAGTNGAGYTLIDTNIASGTVSGTTVYNSLASEEQIFSSTQSGISVAFGTSSGVGVAWSMVVCALQQATAQTTGVPAMFKNFQPTVINDPINYGTYSATKWIPYLDIYNINSRAAPGVYSGITTVNEWLQQDSQRLVSQIDLTNGMATPIVPGLISTGFEYFIGNVYSTRSEIIDYVTTIYPVGFPLSLIVQTPTINSGAATGSNTITSAYNHIQYNEVLGYLQEFQKTLPRNLTVQAPVTQPLAIGPFFPGIAGSYGMSASELGYLAELGKTLPTNLNVQPPLFSVIPPPPPPNTQILTGAQYGMRPEILASLVLVPIEYPYTIQPPFILGQAGVAAILTPGMYGSDHSEIQGYLQDYQLKFPRNLTINPTTTLLPSAVTTQLVTFTFGTKPEILAYLELLKQQQPRVVHTEPSLALGPVIQRNPFVIGGLKVIKGSSNLYVVKGRATNEVEIV